MTTVDHPLMRGFEPHHRWYVAELPLAACVGSMIPQIVFARVLLTAAVRPALPGTACGRVRWRLPWMGSGGFPDQPAGIVTCRATAQRKPASSRAIAAVTTLAGLAGAGELAVPRAEPQLRLPGGLTDRPRLRLLAEQQLTADAGRESGSTRPPRSAVDGRCRCRPW